MTHADHDIVVDLSRVGFLDSSGCAALVAGYNALRGAGRALRTTGERENVLKVLEVAGLTTVLHTSGDIPGDPE